MNTEQTIHTAFKPLSQRNSQQKQIQKPSLNRFGPQFNNSMLNIFMLLFKSKTHLECYLCLLEYHNELDWLNNENVSRFLFNKKLTIRTGY